MALLVVTIFTACGDDAAKKENDSTSTVQEKAENEKADENEKEHDETAHADGPHEPGEDDVCAFCNMKVYPEADPKGVFTAQAKTKDGEYVFFDDSGCLLNITRRDGTEFEEKWVRDYLTSEWVEADTAVPVKAEISTPMNYGYAFFKDKESAEKFIADEGEVKPMIATWEQIDQVANERYMKKMKMKNGGDSGDMEKNEESHTDGDGSSH